MKTTFLAMEAAAALVFIGLCMPLVFRKVPPSRWYGVRVRKTLSDKDLWYEANAYFGRDFIIASVILLFACMALYFYRDAIDRNTFFSIVPAVLMVPYFFAFARTFKCLRRR